MVFWLHSGVMLTQRCFLTIPVQSYLFSCKTSPFVGTKERRAVMLKFLNHLALIRHQIFYFWLMFFKKLQLQRQQVCAFSLIYINSEYRYNSYFGSYSISSTRCCPSLGLLKTKTFADLALHESNFFLRNHESN